MTVAAGDTVRVEYRTVSGDVRTEEHEVVSVDDGKVFLGVSENSRRFVPIEGFETGLWEVVA